MVIEFDKDGVPRSVADKPLDGLCGQHTWSTILADLRASGMIRKNERVAAVRLSARGIQFKFETR
jgi:hypothetical protein